MKRDRKLAGFLGMLLIINAVCPVWAEELPREDQPETEWEREMEESEENSYLRKHLTELAVEVDEPEDSDTWVQVPYISQKGIFPTGCEIVSAMMVLAYYEQDPTLQEVLDHITMDEVRGDGEGRLIGSSPEDAFLGNPTQESGIGCYPPVIMEMLTELLPEERRVEDTTGSSLEELAAWYLEEGSPVLVWATIGMIEPFPTDTWVITDENGEPTEEEFTWLANEHCMVLVGSNENVYYFNDPYMDGGVVAYEKELAQKRYEELGMRSLVVR